MLMPIIPNTNSVLTSCSFYILLPNSNFSAHWTLRYTWQLQDGPIANSFKWKYLIPEHSEASAKSENHHFLAFFIWSLSYRTLENLKTKRQTDRQRDTHTQTKAEREQSGKMWFYFKLYCCKNWEIKIVGNSPTIRQFTLFLNKVLIYNIAFWDPHSATAYRNLKS